MRFSQEVNRIGHIALRVENLERAKSFYIKLGMNLVWDDKDWSYLEAGKGKDGLALLGPSYKAAGPHFAFHFENKEEVEKKNLIQILLLDGSTILELLIWVSPISVETVESRILSLMKKIIFKHITHSLISMD